ncbi:UDP-Glycosyltransferase/glycogen phosphorylase [Trametes gibbosa]|nr:UDP-Glycosyltransferase/glycogen phosphorylase [Trametes gibbosa]
MTSSLSVRKHVVAYPCQAWGHARPLCSLVTRFVKLSPVYVTLLTHDGFFERVKGEIARAFEPHEQEDAAHFLSSRESDERFKLVWENLVTQEPVTCLKTQHVHDKLPRPQAVIIDMFAVNPFQSIKSVSGDTIKVFTWHPGLTYEMFWFWGPENLGGRGNFRLKAEEESRRCGRPYVDIVKELAWGAQGKMVRIPAFPPMYDHEYFPQEFVMMESVLIDIFPYVYESFVGSDGILLFSSESFEPEAVAATKAWYGETSRPAYVVGPLLPSSSQAATGEKNQSMGAEEIQAILDSSLKTLGEHSLLYISFGSLFWPTEPEKLWTVLDVVMERNIPFILSHASPFAVVPDNIHEKIKTYGKGVVSAWTPQQVILNHPATGWFMAHGGQNGVMEALSAGVPQILWPFIADQPLNAIYMTDTLQISYELIEVRSGVSGLHQIYRNGKKPVGTIEALKDEVHSVFGKAFGEDGAKRRQRLLALRGRVNRDWDEGGPSLRDVTAFLKSL